MSRPRRLPDALVSVDPRTLGLVRVGLALALLADLATRVRGWRYWYASDGLLPPDAVLAGGPAGPSFFLGLTAPALVGAGFAACAACYGALLIGFRAGLARLGSVVCVVALHARADPLTTAGDGALVLLAWVTLLLPLGRRLSVDAVVAHLAWRRESTPGALAETAAMMREVSPVRSIWALGPLTMIVGACVAQLLENGSPLLRAVLAVTAFGVLSPVGRPWGRRIALGLGAAAEVGLARGHGDVGFLLAALACLLVLVSREDWEALERRARARPIVVHYDDDCGICFAAARLLVRLDLFGRIEAVPISAARRLPAGFDRADLDNTMLVVDTDSGRAFTRSRAVARVVAALPLGRGVAWVFALPGVSTLADRLYDRLAQNRAVVSAYLGWAACGTGAAGGETMVTEPSLVTEWLRREVARLRELAAVTVGLVLLGCSIVGAPPTWARAAQRHARLHPHLALPSAGPAEARLVLEGSASSKRLDAVADALEAAPRYGVYAGGLPGAPALHAPLAAWLVVRAGGSPVRAAVELADGSRELVIGATP